MVSVPVRLPADAVQQASATAERMSARGVKVRRAAVIAAALEKGLPLVEAEANAPHVEAVQ